MRYAYPCDMTPDVEEGYGFVVTFPDVPEAVTGGDTWDESLFLAEDALIAALSFYVDDREALPVPSAPSDGQALITVPPLQSAKLALYSEMRERGVSKSDLADMLGVSESDIVDLLDLDFDSLAPQVDEAMNVVKSIKAAEGVPA